MVSTSPLSKITIPGSGVTVDKASGKSVFHVDSPHALTQAAGYLKFVYGPKRQSVYFRGQRRLYDGLSPSLYRGIKSEKASSFRAKAIKSACGEIAARNPLFAKMPMDAHEPLLQHYGLNTSWIDLVDNIWVALWFSCYQAKSTGALNQFLHFERRNSATDPSPFAYILLVATDMVESDPYVAGLWRGPKTELIDLRVATQSLFLRPHAQHGVLFRMTSNAGVRSLDYGERIVDIIRIDLHNALGWLGSGSMLNTHALFPPPYYDQGYGFLLDTPLSSNEHIGAINHVGT